MLEAPDLLRRQEEHGRLIAENSKLSDCAKRVVDRETDFEFPRDPIQAAIVRQNWESAQHLIRAMETEPGYHEEAVQFRQRLEAARRATTEGGVAAALARSDALRDRQKWDQARSKAARLARLFPDQASSARWPGELGRRHEYNQQLLRDYEDAVRTEDRDRAHRLPFALRSYLAPREAEALKASARTVFRARLEQLEARVILAVSYKQMSSAIESGERLIHEFPNSGYAREISKLLPVLRQRAAQRSTHASVGARTAS